MLTLKKWREINDKTQAWVANAIGVHVQYVSAIERGVRTPGMSVAVAIRDLTDGAVTLDAQVPRTRTVPFMRAAA